MIRRPKFRKYESREKREGTLCTVVDNGIECGRSASGPGCGRGYCSKHYQRWRVFGDMTQIRAPSGSGHTNKKLGYREVYNGQGLKKYEHIVIAEKAYGGPLPKGAVVHHVTEDKADNHGPFKLVICPNQAYHYLIHKLMREKGISFKTGWPN